MAKYCDRKGGPALYTECLECECKSECQNRVKPAGTVKIIIAGTRTFGNYPLLRKVMSEVAGHIPRDKIEIISGGANGADRLGEVFAKRNGLKLTIFPADWETYGKSAGIIRNRQMAQYAGKAGILVAFWDGSSRGTKNMIDIAQKEGMQCRIVNY